MFCCKKLDFRPFLPRTPWRVRPNFTHNFASAIRTDTRRQCTPVLNLHNNLFCPKYCQEFIVTHSSWCPPFKLAKLLKALQVIVQTLVQLVDRVGWVSILRNDFSGKQAFNQANWMAIDKVQTNRVAVDFNWGGFAFSGFVA